ncbi:MAG: hypothetical protein QOE71_953, partial [Pseudonocardiales bacterium]|nr:hypothetical protein [Pseudonocardiales bacterium]
FPSAPVRFRLEPTGYLLTGVVNDLSTGRAVTVRHGVTLDDTNILMK